MEASARYRLAIGLTALLLAAPASADRIADYLASLPDRPALKQALEPVLREAESANLPLDSLLAKGKEGAAKRVPPAMVARVLAGMLRDLRSAIPLLPEAHRTHDLIDIAAEALRSGAPTEDVQALVAWIVARKAPPAEHRVLLRRGLVLLGDLGQLGAGGEQGLTFVRAVLEGPAASAQEDGLLVWALRHVQRVTRAPWPHVLSEMTSALDSGQSHGGAAQSVLQRRGIDVPVPPGVGPGAPGSGAANGLNGKAAERRPETPPGLDKPDKTPPGLDGKDGTPPGLDKKPDSLPPGQRKGGGKGKGKGKGNGR